MTFSSFINVSHQAVASTVNIEWSTSGRIPKSCRGSSDAVYQLRASDWLKQSASLTVEIPRYLPGQSASTNWICWRGDSRWNNTRLKDYFPSVLKIAASYISVDYAHSAPAFTHCRPHNSSSSCVDHFTCFAMADIKEYTPDDVAGHNTRDDLWVVVNGNGKLALVLSQ